MKYGKWILPLLGTAAMLLPWNNAQTVDNTQFWMKVRAKDKFERSVIADTGAAIEMVQDGFVIVTANLQEKNRLEKLGWVEEATPLAQMLDFPNNDSDFHNYTELKQALDQMAAEFPDVVRLSSIGITHQGRDIWSVRISTDVDSSGNKPAVLYLGGHHAREHVSVEIPLRFVQGLLNDYKNGNARAIKYLQTREIHLIPAVNPDGLEYDVEGGRYKMWRKNRRLNATGNYGVDLNRNYGYQWGTGGSSTDTGSDVYMGQTPFSEPETQAVKTYIESHKNISILLSFHTYSKLILYPWGHKYDPIADSRDRQVHETMARKMSEWNGYTPQTSSDLYIASGDLTDWSYGQHKIISFTFELDPANQWGGGGFYPGQGVIPDVLRKNTEPCYYLLEYADNPYRVLDSSAVF